MASFTDNNPALYSFNPWVDTLQSDALIKVEMEKQRQWEMGYQQVQGAMQTIAGLPVEKKEAREYLQGRLNQLKDSIGRNTDGDFGNSRLLNQIGGLTNRIANDPVIKNAVQAAAHNAGVKKRMEEDQKAGKMGYFNQAKYLSEYNNWLNDGQLNTQLQASYDSYYDTDKVVKEALDGVHEDELLEQGAVRDEKTGKINYDVLLEKHKKGLLKGKVANIVSRVLSKPEAMRQLEIDAWGMYQNRTPQDMAGMQLESYQLRKEALEEQLDTFKNMTKLTKDQASQASKAILQIQDELKNLAGNYNSYVELLETNPDAAKTQFHRENLLLQYTNQYSWESITNKMIKSPAAEMEIDRLTLQLNVAKEEFDRMDKDRRYELDVKKAELDMKKADGTLNADGTPKILWDPSAVDPKITEGYGADTYKAETEKLNTQKTQLQAMIITRYLGKDIFIETPEGYKWNPKYKNWKEVEVTYLGALKALEKLHLNGDVAPEYREAVAGLFDMNSQFAQRKTIEKEIDTEFEGNIKEVRTTLQKAIPVDYSVHGKLNSDELKNVKKQSQNPALIDVYIVQKRLPGASQAEARLKAKYGEDWRVKSGAYVDKGYAPGGKIKVVDEHPAYKIIRENLDKNKSVIDITEAYHGAYRSKQMESKNLQGTFNITDAEELRALNQAVNKVVSNVIGDKSKGDWATMVEWLDPSKDENLRKNQYQVYKDNTGQYYLQVQRHAGSGYELSPAIPLSSEMVSQLNIDKYESPAKQRFDGVFGGFLDNFNWRKTTKDFDSEEASVTAINRRKIGRYSVGVHLEELNGGFIPRLYIRNPETGEVIRNNVKLDFSAWAKDPDLPEELRKVFDQATSVISKEDVLAKLDMLDERFIELLLK